MHGMHGTIRHKVEVDQRALVDKILARYATDFGALRELVQNADDAGATEVEVQLLFAIGGSEPCCIKVWNNGRAFNEADWLRVRKIAAGNPDESSVGLFGVGFFSVFALTDAPEIHSGSVRLRFSWEDEELVADESPLPVPKPGAAFVMPLKPSSDALEWVHGEGLARLRGMLASMLLFSKSVGRLTLRMRRPTADPSASAPADGDEELVLSRELTPLRALPHAAAAVPGMPPLFYVPAAKPGRPPELEVGSLVLRARSMPSGASEVCRMVCVSGVLGVKVSIKRHAELLKSLAVVLKKAMPQLTPLRLLYSMPPPPSSATQGAAASVEVAASVAPSAAMAGELGGGELGMELGGLFRGAGGGEGLLYIGSGATQQTCGAGFHACSCFLPTMERTALDFSNRDIATWNRELLAACGAFARSYYIDEAQVLGGSLPGFLGPNIKVRLLSRKESAAPKKKEDAEEGGGKKPPAELSPARVALLKAHSFGKSTPNQQVTKLLADAFFAQGDALPVASSAGHLPAREVHSVPPALREVLEFVPALPLVPPSAEAQGCLPFYQQLAMRGVLRSLDAAMLHQQLAAVVLRPEPVVRLLRWFFRARKTPLFRDEETAIAFKRAVRFAATGTAAAEVEPTAGAEVGSGIACLADLTHHPLGELDLATALPTPPSCLPRWVAQQLSRSELQLSLGLRPLDFAAYWSYVAGETAQPLLLEARFAPLLLQLAAEQHDALPPPKQAALIQGLQSCRCIPAVSADEQSVDSSGEQDAERGAEQGEEGAEAAGAAAGGVKQGAGRGCEMRYPAEVFLGSDAVTLLRGLGLPVAVGLSGVSVPFLSRLGLRSHPPMARVLQGLDTLHWSFRELARYLLAREVKAPLPDAEWHELRDHAASAELGYLPLEAYRQLGLPLLPWSGKPVSSEERSALVRLGVRERPPLQLLLEKAADSAAGKPTQDRSLSFVCAHMDEWYAEEFDPQTELHIVPTLGKARARPCSCYIERSPWPERFASVAAEFSGAQQRIALQLPQRPPMHLVLEALIEAPPSEVAAAEVFEYMGKRAAELEPAAWQHLATAPLVPIKRAGGGHLPPNQVFFSGGRKKFGPLLEYCETKQNSAAGAFLAQCGVNDTPSVATLAAAIASNHERFLASMGSVSSYLSLLKELAKGLRAEPPAKYGDALPPETRAALRRACCLVGVRGADAKKWKSVSAADCVIGDHPRLVRLFKPLAAPEDGALKQLYALLGVRSISSAVQVTHTPDTEHASASKLARHVRQRILERACLLLHDIDHPSCPPRAHLRPLAEEALRRGEVEVLEVRAISSTLHFCQQGKPQTVTEASNACVLPREGVEGGEAGVGMRVYVVPMSDQRLLLEAVGDALLGELLEASTSSEKLVFGQLLASPLDALRQRGFNVDRFQQEIKFAEDQKREQCALHLQAAARGTLVRCRQRARRAVVLEARRTVCVTSIQREARRLIARRTFLASHAQRRGLAATRLQCVIRSYIARSRLVAARGAAELNARQSLAAARVQRAWRMLSSLRAAEGMTAQRERFRQGKLQEEADAVAVAEAERSGKLNTKQAEHLRRQIETSLFSSRDSRDAEAAVEARARVEAEASLQPPPSLALAPAPEAAVEAAVEVAAASGLAVSAAATACASLPPGLRVGPPAPSRDLLLPPGLGGLVVPSAAAALQATATQGSDSELSWGDGGSDTSSEGEPRLGRRRHLRDGDGDEDSAGEADYTEYGGTYAFDTTDVAPYGDDYGCGATTWSGAEAHPKPPPNDAFLGGAEPFDPSADRRAVRNQAGQQGRSRLVGAALASRDGLTPAMLAARAEMAADDEADEVDSLCSSDAGGEEAQLPRLAEMRSSALPTEAANGLLWRDVAAASRLSSLPPGPPGPPWPEAAGAQACCSYATATTSGLAAGTWGGGDAEVEQGLELASARTSVVSDPRAAQAHVEGGSLKFGCFSGYGEGAPSATSLWQPGGVPSAASGAVLLPLSQQPPYALGVPAAHALDQHSAVASRVEHELRLLVAQLEDRASAAEHRLVAAEQDNQRLRQRSDPHTAGQQAELSRRMAIIQEQHDQHHRSLHERITKAEADLDSMLLEPLLESSATLEEAQRASSEVGQKLLLLEERGTALATAEASQRCDEQQRAQHELSTLAEEIREALGAQHTRNPAARLQQLQQSMREWGQRASHAASDEWLQAAAEAGEAVARPRRAVVASGGLATRALGDALAASTRGRKAERAASARDGSTTDANCAPPASSELAAAVALPPTWQSQLPPRSAEQIWFANETPAVAEANVLVSDVADNCAASGLVRRGDRVLTINGVKVTDEQQGTALACVDMDSHRVLQPPSCLPYAPEAQGSLPQRRTAVRAPYTYQPREYRLYRAPHAVTLQALAKAAVGDVVYYILRGEELVTVTAHKPEAATRLGVTIKNLTDDQQASNNGRGRGGLGTAGRGTARGAQGESERGSPPEEASSGSFEVEVSLHKLKQDSRLGMTLAGSGFPLVEKLAEGGAAYGRLVEGDVLLSVNGQEACGHEATTTLLKSLQGAVLLNVLREAPGTHG